MKKAEIVFLISVLGFAALFSFVSVQEALPLLPGRSSPGATATGTAGQPRDVDVQRLQQMLRQRDLSSHEALYYKPVPAAADAGSQTPGTQAPAPPQPRRSQSVDQPGP